MESVTLQMAQRGLITIPRAVRETYRMPPGDTFTLHGRSSVAVMVRLLETVAVIAAHTRTQTERAALRRQAQTIQQGSTTMPETHDRQAAKERYQQVIQILEQP